MLINCAVSIGLPLSAVMRHFMHLILLSLPLQGSSLSFLKRKSREVIWHEESYRHSEGKGQHAGEEVLK